VTPWIEQFFSVCLNRPLRHVDQEAGKYRREAMLSITLKSAMLVAGLVLTSVFLQMAMSYGSLPFVVGQ
jgi:hypothetical protein